MTNLHYKLILNNNVEYVFDKLFSKEYYEQWTVPFNPDASYTGVFGKGNEIFFHDSDNNGMKVLVTEFEINKIVEFTYHSEVVDGVETEFKNSGKNYERYSFQNLQDKMMMLDIELAMPKEFQDFFEDAWAQSIVIIQDLFDNEED